MKKEPESRTVRDKVFDQNQLLSSISGKSMIRGAIAAALFICLLGVMNFAHGQDDQSNPRFTEGDINDSASLSFSVPMGSYKGRGLDLPISLSYSSSDLWKMEYIGNVHNSLWPALTQGVNEAYYSKFATSGWKSSLSLPIIEFPKSTSRYDIRGKASSSLVGGPGYRISEVYIHMPDGSSRTLRKNDQPFYGDVEMTGTFYAVDGSRMRFDANGTSDTATIYMPDGTRYILGHPTSYIIDRHGNTLTYDETTRTWTDTLGRQIANPLPATPTVGDVDYYLPGLAGVGSGQLKYTFKWKLLENALTPDGSGNPPPLGVVGSEALPNPYIPPSDSGNYPSPQSAGLGRLFQSTPPHYGGEGQPTVSGLVVGKGYYAGQLFNPVVLTEIVLPDGTSYKYSYNVYGEIDKVIYPTNAYEKYEPTSDQQYVYVCYPSSWDCEEDQQPYLQTLRWVSKRQQSPDGTGNDLREWTYINTPLLDGGGATKIIAPDKTRTEIYRYGAGPKTVATYGQNCQNFVQIYPFGFKDARVGMVSSKKFYSTSPDGLGGSLLRQEVYQYEQTTQNYTFSFVLCGTTQNRTYALRRTPRLERQTNIIFEGSGDALAQSTTYQYDLTHEWDTGIDQTQAATYNYVVVDNQVARDTDTPEELAQIPLGAVSKSSETIFGSDAGYQSANILGIPTVSMIKDAAGTIVSQSEMVYDECPQYCVTAGKALPTSMRTWDSTKGAVTNPSAYLLTHATFDQYGNRTIATDAKGFSTTTTYDPTYQAFPVIVTSSVPDPSGTQGSNSAFTTTTTYDFTTGLPLSTTDANGQTTQMEYNDPLLRPTRVIAPNGQQTITEYGAGTSEATRWVKVRSQIDTNFWSEARSFYDGLGRTYLTQKTDSGGDVFAKTEYDIMGRVKRSTNPYRTGEAELWSTPEYDDLSRTKKVISPDANNVQITYGLSTTGIIGTTKTITDQAGRKRTGITDALGRMIRVIEDPDGQALVTDYVFDTLGNLRKTTQGEQARYFSY